MDAVRGNCGWEEIGGDSVSGDEFPVSDGEGAGEEEEVGYC